MVYFLLSYSFIALQIAREGTTVVGGRPLKFCHVMIVTGRGGWRGRGKKENAGGKTERGSYGRGRIRPRPLLTWFVI